MQRDSFTKALQATARVACAASLLQLGCRTKTPAETAEPSSSPNTFEDTAQTDASTHETGQDSTHEDTSVIQDTSLSEDSGSTILDTADFPMSEDVSTCREDIQNYFVEGTFPDPTTVPAEIKDCCALTAAYFDELAMVSGVYDYMVIDQWTYRNQCCSALEWSDGSMACTPWGPPTPPSARKMNHRILSKDLRRLVSPLATV